MKPYKYLTVLDFEQGDVCQYPLENCFYDIDYEEDIELKIIELGHNLTNCEWMIHKNEPIIH